MYRIKKHTRPSMCLLVFTFLLFVGSNGSFHYKRFRTNQKTAFLLDDATIEYSDETVSITTECGFTKEFVYMKDPKGECYGPTSFSIPLGSANLIYNKSVSRNFRQPTTIVAMEAYQHMVQTFGTSCAKLAAKLGRIPTKLLTTGNTTRPKQQEDLMCYDCVTGARFEKDYVLQRQHYYICYGEILQETTVLVYTGVSENKDFKTFPQVHGLKQNYLPEPTTKLARRRIALSFESYYHGLEVKKTASIYSKDGKRKKRFVGMVLGAAALAVGGTALYKAIENEKEIDRVRQSTVLALQAQDKNNNVFKDEINAHTRAITKNKEYLIDHEIAIASNNIRVQANTDSINSITTIVEILSRRIDGLESYAQFLSEKIRIVSMRQDVTQKITMAVQESEAKARNIQVVRVSPSEYIASWETAMFKGQENLAECNIAGCVVKSKMFCELTKGEVVNITEGSILLEPFYGKCCRSLEALHAEKVDKHMCFSNGEPVDGCCADKVEPYYNITFGSYNEVHYNFKVTGDNLFMMDCGLPKCKYEGTVDQLYTEITTLNTREMEITYIEEVFNQAMDDVDAKVDNGFSFKIQMTSFTSMIILWLLVVALWVIKILECHANMRRV